MAITGVVSVVSPGRSAGSASVVAGMSQMTQCTASMSRSVSVTA
jgi:hypothetical protein